MDYTIFRELEKWRNFCYNIRKEIFHMLYKKYIDFF
ncbi:hypothetical protein BCE_5158 [Bacillus cereus ATCC 10987]|uniref:Uncharacterized protein n=1 Tax=Bacillus cereus (strain ATCC 10987 / NRS 248) TaxID=222523 RepID=Q72Y63_BACC1|nr:hypothetical protein BCE_5158 [Bacillus cereus ATCC 10987]